MSLPDNFDVRPRGGGIWLPKAVWEDPRISRRQAFLYGYLVAYGRPVGQFEPRDSLGSFYEGLRDSASEISQDRDRLLELGLLTPERVFGP